MNWVFDVVGIPTEGMFGGLRGAGSPLIVDSATAKIYYWLNGAVTEVGGGGGGGSAAWGGITGTLSAQTDLQSALDGKQPLSAILTATTASFTSAQETKLAGIAAGATANQTDAFLLSRANHTGTQDVSTITGLGTLATQDGTFSGTSSGTNTGDQTSIVGITGTLAEFNAALTGADFATGGGTATGTNTGDQTTISGNAGSATVLQTGRTLSITGDLTWTSPSFDGSSNVSAGGTLATVNSNVGTFGSSTLIPVVTVNGKGLITAISTVAASGGGGGTTLNSGVTTVNFGAFPGSSDTSTTITGQTGILAGSKVKAYILPTATADHTVDEHWVETLEVIAGGITPGVGFTIWAKNTNTLSEPVLGQWANTRLAGPGTGIRQIRPDLGGGTGTRLYGQFTVAWEWF